MCSLTGQTLTLLTGSCIWGVISAKMLNFFSGRWICILLFIMGNNFSIQINCNTFGMWICISKCRNTFGMTLTSRHSDQEWRMTESFVLMTKEQKLLHMYRCTMHMSRKPHPFSELCLAVGSTYKTYLFTFRESQRWAILMPISRLRVDDCRSGPVKFKE